MLFWLTLVLLIAVLVFSIWRSGNDFLEFSFVEVFATLLLIATLIVEMIALGVGHMGVDAHVEQNKERYKAITYKIENGIYEDDFGIMTPSGISEVQEWNEDVVYYQGLQEDFWLGIFVPNVYDQFECIDYTDYKTDKENENAK